MDFWIWILAIFIIHLGSVASELSLKFVFIVESEEEDLGQKIGRAIKVAENQTPGLRVSDDIIHLDREHDEESYRKLCSALSNGVSIIIDVSWSPWEQARDIASAAAIPYVFTVLGAQKLVEALDGYFEARNATDAAFLLPDERDVDQVLYQLLGESSVRVWMHAGLNRDATNALRSMRPEPSFYVVVGDNTFVTETYRRAVKEKLVRRDFRWNLLLTDYSVSNLDISMAMPTILLSVDPSECCRLLGQKDDCHCPSEIQRTQHILNAFITYVTESYSKLSPDLPATTIAVDCEIMQPSVAASPTPAGQSVAVMNATKERLTKHFVDNVRENNDTMFFWDQERSALFLRSRFLLSSFKPDEGIQLMASWSADEQFHFQPGVTLEPLRMFFRVGTTPAVPWTLPKLDPDTGEPVFDDEGQPLYEGYCIDLLEKLAETMEFDYEIVTPKVGTFGRKLPNGSWDGVVGDLMRGETEFAVAALTMTAEREEVLDFVAPYFDQTGILIVIRKPTRKTSLFKFMTVLRTEVWLSIVAALVLTGFMIWLLDKYSPYSARNNPEAYPYPCREFTLKESFWFALTSFTPQGRGEVPKAMSGRTLVAAYWLFVVLMLATFTAKEFTLKESFWFALTSFTPQGGGEAPKALSGRTLVAAYWLFVVLMLATFTANLAAFLTVERMQTPVSSLEQLARQSRINYTVVEGSTIHQYFINMKFAEDTLYRVWKEITLNATSDQAQYRVWDYPIREQYGHILLAINASGPVADAQTGFREVDEHTDADFAFIHDSAEIKYEVTRNCNLTEVGEVFAEQPYAIAVQQGSRLQEDLSRALLDLQKERFLEQLGAKYWNESKRQECPDADESEGITLESLGGVFIATLFGLGLAMLTLAWEVFYYKRKERNKVTAIDATVEKPKQAFAAQKKTLIETKMAEKVSKLRRRDKKRQKMHGTVTIGDTFKPAAENPIAFVTSVYQGGFKP